MSLIREYKSIQSPSSQGFRYIKTDNKFTYTSLYGNLDDPLTYNYKMHSSIYLTENRYVYGNFKVLKPIRVSNPVLIESLSNKNIGYVDSYQSSGDFSQPLQGFFYGISEDGHIYYATQLNDFNLESITLPDDELAYKLILNKSVQPVILTMRGNVYFHKNRNTLIKQSICNVSHISNLDNDGNGNFIYLTKDGKVYYHTINASSIQIQNLPKIKLLHGGNADTYTYIAVDESNKIYIIDANQNIVILNNYEIEGINNIIDVFTGAAGYDFYILDDQYHLHQLLGTYDENIDDFVWTVTKDFITDIRPNIYRIIPYVNLNIDYYTYTYQSIGTNLTFKYRFRLKQNLNVSGTSNVVNYVCC